MKIEDALASYVLQLEADGRAPSTISQYQRHITLLARWLGTVREIEDIHHDDLARFLISPDARTRPDGRPKKASAMNGLRSSLRTFFGWVCDAGYTERNVARLIRRARCGPPPARALSEDEQRRLLAALDAGTGEAAERDHALFALMLASGIRLGSALGLNIEDLDLGAGEATLYKVKGDRVERVFLSPGIRDHLARFVDGRGSGPVFLSRHGARLGARQAQRRFEELCERAGIGRVRGTHTLRHSFGTSLYRRTGDVLLVKQALGHRNVASTMVYAACDERRVRQAMMA